MKLIIGLGNPGKEYESTRHNAGFRLVDELKKEASLSDFEFNKKLNAEISKGIVEKERIILAKPHTFMNISGEAVRSILAFYKLTPDDLLILHDDIDIPLGQYRLATDSRSAGHNGVQNIIDKLGTQKFRRIRIGIRPEESPTYDASDFVLKKFSHEETEKMEKIFPDIMEEIKIILREK